MLLRTIIVVLAMLPAGTLSASSGLVATDEVSKYELSEDRSGYPCVLSLETDSRKGLTVQLSNYKDIWSIKFTPRNHAAVYQKFFDDRGWRDAAAFRSAFKTVQIGGQNFDLHKATLFEAKRNDVDENTVGIFSINEKHNVARALEAMTSDGVAIPGIFNIRGSVEAMSAFRSCSYAAMKLKDGEHVDTDFLAEYRMIFEKSFEAWVTSLAISELCLADRIDDAAVDEVIEAATTAFYPGLFNLRKRSAYRKDLERRLPFAKLSGMNEALSGNCLMVERLAELSRIPVDQAIKAAAD